MAADGSTNTRALTGKSSPVPSSILKPNSNVATVPPITQPFKKMAATETAISTTRTTCASKSTVIQRNTKTPSNKERMWNGRSHLSKNNMTLKCQTVRNLNSVKNISTIAAILNNIQILKKATSQPTQKPGEENPQNLRVLRI